MSVVPRESIEEHQTINSDLSLTTYDLCTDATGQVAWRIQFARGCIRRRTANPVSPATQPLIYRVFTDLRLN